MNELKVNGYEWQTPSSYNELTPSQLLKVCYLILVGGFIGQQGVLYDQADIRRRLLCVLMGVKRGFFKHSKKVKSFLNAPPEVQTWLMYDQDITGWVFEPARLSHYTIQHFMHKRRMYYGPHDGMMNISIAELVESIMYFTAYQDSLKQKPKPQLLDNLIAVLYREQRLFYRFEKFKADFSFDRRASNNPLRFSRRVKRFEKLPQELKVAIFLQYEGALSSFAKSFPKSFKKKKGKSDLNGWIKLLMSMSNDIFGNYQQTQKMDAYTFFTKVEHNIDVADRAKQNLS